MPRPNFIDAHPQYNGPDCYTVTNEECVLLKHIIGRTYFGKVGGIASSGDVWLSTLLPRSREAVFVDHNYGSLATSFLKAILLDTLGVRQFKALMVEKPYREFYEACRKASEELPEPLRGKLTLPEDPGQWTYPSISTAVHTDLRREWVTCSDKSLENSLRKLDKVTLVHGDLQDLKKWGPFDGLYVSNAVASSHKNRDGISPQLDYVAPLVRKDGLLLIAIQASATALRGVEPYWKSVRRVNALWRGWHYEAYKRQADPAPTDQPVIIDAGAAAAV